MLKRFLVKAWDFCEAVGKKIYRFWEKHPVVSSIISFVAASTICILLWPNPVAYVVILVVSVHEYTHYITAKMSVCERAWPPIFFPIGIGLIGMTRIQGLAPQHIVRVAASGPIAGMLVALILFGLMLYLALPTMAFISGIAFVWELYSICLGTDSRRIKQWRIQQKDPLSTKSGDFSSIAPKKVATPLIMTLMR